MSSYAISNHGTHTGARRKPVRTSRSTNHRRTEVRPTLAYALLALLLLATVIVSLSVLASRSDAVTPSVWRSVAVAPATTLWDLAAANPVAGLDTPQTVALIRAENNLEDSVLYPGQTVLVPAGVTLSERPAVASR